MDSIYIDFLIAVPITIFVCGFILARQIRGLENAPFIKHKFRFSAFIGGGSSILLAIISSLTTGLSIQQLLIIFGLFLLVTFSGYCGITIGSGRPSSETNNVTSVNRHQNNTLPENVIVDNQPSSIKITISTKKRWGLLAMAVFPLPIMICILPFVGLGVVSLMQRYLPTGLNILAAILVIGMMLYALYKQFRDVLEYLFDKEVIRIDNLSVRVEKYGSGFKSIKEYPADNIKTITALFSFAGANTAIKRSPFINQNVPAFILWHERGLIRFRYFGRGLDMANAQRILESVYTKYPQYRG